MFLCSFVYDTVACVCVHLCMILWYVFCVHLFMILWYVFVFTCLWYCGMFLCSVDYDTVVCFLFTCFWHCCKNWCSLWYVLMYTCLWYCYIRKGKHRALSREVTCNFRFYLIIGRTSVNSTSNYRCLHISVSRNTTCGWNRLDVNIQWVGIG